MINISSEILTNSTFIKEIPYSLNEKANFLSKYTILAKYIFYKTTDTHNRIISTKTPIKNIFLLSTKSRLNIIFVYRYFRKSISRIFILETKNCKNYFESITISLLLDILQILYTKEQNICLITIKKKIIKSTIDIFEVYYLKKSSNAIYLNKEDNILKVRKKLSTINFILKRNRELDYESNLYLLMTLKYLYSKNLCIPNKKYKLPKNMCQNLLTGILISKIFNIFIIDQIQIINIYFCLKFCLEENILEKNKVKKIFNNIFEKFKEKDNYCKNLTVKSTKSKKLLFSKLKLFNKLLNLKKLFKKMNFIYKITENNSFYSKTSRLDNLKGYLSSNKSFIKEISTVSPFDHKILLYEIDYKNIEIFQSSTFPLIIPFISSKGVYKIIYKKGCDLRNDYIIVSLINYFSSIIKIPLITYKVLPLNINEGIIEYIPETFNIDELILKFSSLSNFLFQSNTNMNLFIESLAAYTIITYLLGIGDRNRDNMLFHNSGQIFHIDFSYIFGKDPKPFPPKIVILPEVSYFFKNNLLLYSKFIDLCQKIYNKLRKNTQKIYFYIQILQKNPYCNYKSEIIFKFLKKYLNLEKDDFQANLHIKKLIEESLKSYKTKINHFINKLGKILRK
ncbi:Phosphatidylinositol (PI) 3-kinase [Hamiltosporidium tvaerminnensis]|nr:Phosphatidylinositol (PI) 3-kinase [Hamiltosporidium tvaerminnensis]